MAEKESKFQLLALDKRVVVSLVNTLGAEAAREMTPFTPEIIKNNLADVASLVTSFSHTRTVKAVKLDLDEHKGRKDFLNKIGIDSETPDSYRLLSFTNSVGQRTLFKGRMVDNKLVLTDSIALADRSSRDTLHELMLADFKPLPKPIEVVVEKESIGKDGSRNLELAPEEKMKLELQSTLAAAIHKSGDVELASNSRLPAKQQSTGPAIST